MHKCVIFDVDGTLIDGTDGIIKSLSYTINILKYPPLSQKMLKQFVGPPVQQSCKIFFNTTDEEAQIFTNIFRQRLCDNDLFFARVYNGIYELLNFLKQQDYKLGIATYKREDLVLKLINNFNLDKYFDAVCGADNENKLKKSEIILKCIQLLNSDISTAIMIGDSHYDAEAARKINLSFIGVTYGFGFKTAEDVKSYSPIIVANNVYEILNYFKNKIV